MRRYYGVDFKRGERLRVAGVGAGKLVSFPGQYLGVRLDGESWTSKVHPLDAKREQLSPEEGRNDG